MEFRIDHITNDLIDRSQWDEWVKRAQNRRIYATSVFLDIYSPRWEALVIGNGQAFMPLARNRKYGISYLFQPIFVQQLGCFFLKDSCFSTIPLFIEKLSGAFCFADIALNEMNNFNFAGYQPDKIKHPGGNFHPDAFKQNRGVSNDRKKGEYEQMYNYLLKLDKPYDTLAGKYSTGTRRNINKARRLNTELLPYYEPGDIVKLFAGNRGRLYPNIRRINYKRLKSLLERGLSDGFIQIRIARSPGGRLIAAACLLKDFDRYVFYFSANTPEGRNYGAMFLLIDSFIRQYAGTGMLFDFNGSMDPGVARFYRGFGAEKAVYPRVRINRLWYPFNKI